MPARSPLTAAAFTLVALSALSLIAGPPSALAQSPAPAGAKVFFIEPKNGAEISGPVAVKMGLTGMEIAPAGTEKPNSGHHHILIDTPLKDPKSPLPADDNHRHFGKGQTEATLELKPGKHTLQLVLGDHNHAPHDPPVVSEVITITVK